MSNFEGTPSSHPVEELRTLAIDDFVRDVRGDGGLYESPWEAWVMIAHFTGTRLLDFRAIAYTEGRPPTEMVLAKRNVRRSLERLCVVMEGPEGRLPQAMLFTYRDATRHFTTDFAYDQDTADRWDVHARGVRPVAIDLDPFRR